MSADPARDPSLAQHPTAAALAWLAADDARWGRYAVRARCLQAHRLSHGGVGWRESVWSGTDGLTDATGRLAPYSDDDHALALLALDARLTESVRLMLASPFATAARVSGQYGVALDVTYAPATHANPQAIAALCQALAAPARVALDVGVQVDLFVDAAIASVMAFVPLGLMGADGVAQIARQLAAAAPLHPVCYSGGAGWPDDGGAWCVLEALEERSPAFAMARRVNTGPVRVPFTPALHWLGVDLGGYATWRTSRRLAASPMAAAVAAERERIAAAGAPVLAP